MYHHKLVQKKLYGYDYENMKPWSVQAVNEAVRGFKTEPQGISSITDIAHKMAQNEINTDPMRHINHNTLGKNKINPEKVFKKYIELLN